ncbi:MAG: hypothetical protein V3V74_05735 [Nitrosomonadaceae bacterium]
MFLFLAQIPTNPPTSFYALSWIALGAMAAALVYVFRQWQAERKNCTDRYKKTIDKLLLALHEQLDDNHDVDISDMD